MGHAQRTRMPSNPLERPGTTRRRFVIDTLGSLATAAWAGACGSGAEVTNSTKGTGGARGPDGSGGKSGETASTGAAPGGAGSGGLTGGTGGTTGSDSGICALYPQETEGPFYLNLALLRSDITEGKAGAPLELEVQVVSANGCMPVKDAAVDIWQCDAAGVYAGFPGQLGGLDTTGQKSLRGTQVTGADGRVVFKTIYPGWYPGRTTHIHFKVHLSATSEVTSQLYFPEETTAKLYQTPPYDVHGPKDTSNAADATAQAGGMPPVVVITESSGALAARLVITVLG